jgi:hypothetical protein
MLLGTGFIRGALETVIFKGSREGRWGRFVSHLSFYDQYSISNLAV